MKLVLQLLGLAIQGILYWGIWSHNLLFIIPSVSILIIEIAFVVGRDWDKK